MVREQLVSRLVELPPELMEAMGRLPALPQDRLRAAVARLSGSYRAGRPTAIANEDDAAAYVIYRMPATYAAATAALRATKAALLNSQPRSLLDVGAGMGAAAWAATRIFPSIDQVVLVESDPRMRQVGQFLAESDPTLQRAAWKTDICDQADIVVVSYALGEMPAAVIERLWDATRQVLLVVEPGTPAGYATVIDARRYALAQGAYVAAPCPHGDECPLEPPAWCHFSQRLPRTHLHRSVKDASLSWEDEKFSYVALSRKTPTPVRTRLIGRPRYGKRVVRLPLCTVDGIQQRTVAKSDRAYKQARHAAWGDAFDPRRSHEANV